MSALKRVWENIKVFVSVDINIEVLPNLLCLYRVIYQLIQVCKLNNFRCYNKGLLVYIFVLKYYRGSYLT